MFLNKLVCSVFYRYVHNNIFFSFAVDADLGHMSKSEEPNVQMNSSDVSENCEYEVSCNPPARTAGNKLFGAPANSSLCMSTSPDKEQKQGVSDLMTDASAEAQIADGEQATYASANNDLKGTKAYQEADVPGLYNLAMAIVDYRGYRVVAQVVEAAKCLHLKEHMVLDGLGNAVKLAAPVECKGIVGSDDR
ncbi:hypothetical protein BHM03_00049852 [Ensete ventricosum]|nr:hypothetical protein BHM03_00049852 [Ensete ventricosum]